jgi:hypothetical protein
VRRVLSRGNLLAVLALGGLGGCLSVDEVQTPNGDIQLSRDEAAPEGGTDPRAAGADDAVCGTQGFRVVRAAGRDQLGAWSRASLVPSCTGTRNRLSALAPRLGSSFAIELNADGSQVLSATYSTTSVGADGEEWGEYEALVDVGSLRFLAQRASGEQPFELVGNILGPFGPVSFEASGCAQVRLNPC